MGKVTQSNRKKTCGQNGKKKKGKSMLAEGKVEIGTAGSVKAHVEQQVRHRCHKGLEVLTQDVKRNVMLMSF